MSSLPFAGGGGVTGCGVTAAGGCSGSLIGEPLVVAGFFLLARVGRDAVGGDEVATGAIVGGVVAGSGSTACAGAFGAATLGAGALGAGALFVVAAGSAVGVTAGALVELVAVESPLDATIANVAMPASTS
ncbi:MAG TPA: hypothetical protein VIV40_26900, partial [Kofleriaceae bacterium]